MTHFTVSKIDLAKLLQWGDLGASPHNFLAVGAIAPIAPMESAPMTTYEPCLTKII